MSDKNPSTRPHSGPYEVCEANGITEPPAYVDNRQDHTPVLTDKPVSVSDILAAENGDSAAAARLPMSEWAESRREHMTPQTIAANHRLHIATEPGAYGIEEVPHDTPGAIHCTECGRSWAEDITPAGRCPWESDHEEAPLTFTLTITLGNDAMQSDHDIARALRAVANTLSESDDSPSNLAGPELIRDVNGNRVGEWGVK